MKAFILLAVWLAWALPAQALDFDRYHSQEDINSWMRQMARQAPELVRFHTLGYSEQGREIAYVVIAKGDPETMQSVYFNGAHHGNEKSSTETVLGMIDHLIAKRHDPEISKLLESYAFYLQPVVNPDGHALNMRGDARGRDPNRDYSFPERHEDESFKLGPVKLVKELTDRVRFRAAAAFHSGMEGVLWPWCYAPQRAADTDTFYTISKISAEAMGMSRYLQSYRDYPTRGEFIDYMYMSHGTLALTIEVSNEGNPPERLLTGYVRRAVLGALTFVHSVMLLDEGRLEIQRAPDPALLLARARAAGDLRRPE